MFCEIINSVRSKRPLIHCITNPISITRYADAILSAGAKPIMAEHPKEVSEITNGADALVLNLGNITDVRMEAMLVSAKTASENNIPFVVDAVGVGCSKLRRNYIKKLLEYSPTVIKGNYSEIMALCDDEYKTSGVDAEFSDIDCIKGFAKSLAQKYNCIILASGKTDVVTDGIDIFGVRNGTYQLANITGTGCMLGALCGCYISASSDIFGVLTACGVLGISGERAETIAGNGAFAVRLMDELSADFKEEEFKIEKL